MSQRARRTAAPKCPRGWHRDTLGRHPSRHGRAPHALAAPQLANFLGWRTGEPSDATYYRGISCRILEAYADRITDPIRRYFEEIGIVTASGSPWRLHQPPMGSGLSHA